MASKIPWVITCPRSGTIWLQNLMELYFDAPHGPNQTGGITWRPPKIDEEGNLEPFMWQHSHDEGNNIEPSDTEVGDIFIYRNPIDAIFSLNKIPGHPGDINSYAEHFKRLVEKWSTEARTIITYEEAVADTLSTLKIISEHFRKDWKQEHAIKCIKKTSKKKILKKGSAVGSRYHNTNLLNKNYNKEREEFKKQYGPQIMKIVSTKKTEQLLSKVLQ